MLMKSTLSQEAILAATDRLPFSDRERMAVQAGLQASRSGVGPVLDLVAVRGPEGDPASGVVVLKPAASLDRAMLVKARIAGSGYFPRSRNAIFCFRSVQGKDEWLPLGECPSVQGALALVGNMYSLARKSAADPLPLPPLAGTPAL